MWKISLFIMGKDFRIIGMVRLCRLEHWIKNGLIFLPSFFLGDIFSWPVIGRLLPAFISYSCLTSVVYVINDLCDLERDRSHPTKCKRPLASGLVGPLAAVCLAAILSLLGFYLLVFAHSILMTSIVLCGYLVSNVLYSIRFKNIPIIDIFLLASGFVFRIFFGGFYFGAEISSWLFLSVFSGALFFACGKRKNEKAQVSSRATRPVLLAYSQKFLDAHYYMFCGLSILFYCLWTISRTNQHAVGKLALTIPILIFILARYNFIIESGKSDGDPVPVLLRDKILVLSTLAFAMVNFVVLYFGQYLPRISY